MRRFVLGCVTAAALLTGAVGASAAYATTVTIGQVAGAGQVGFGTSCGPDCRFFQRSTDDAASPSYEVPAGNWVLTSWSTRAGTQPPELPPIEPLVATRQATGVRMFLVESEGGSNYTLSAQSPEVETEADRINTYPGQIPVQGGWRLGLDGGSGHTVTYETFIDDDVTAAYANETVGTTAPSSTEFSGFRVNLAAKLESDCDSDGLGDDTQDNDLSACTAAPGPGPGPGPGPAPGPAEAAATCKGIPATIVGTPGDDVRTGSQGRDVMLGLEGNDTLRGLAGNDVICGAKGNDALNGGKGKDTLLGQKGNDKLKGGPGKDKLSGKKGKDTLKGGGGNDKLKGGGGRDLCIGGKANDTASKCEVEKSI